MFIGHISSSLLPGGKGGSLLSWEKGDERETIFCLLFPLHNNALILNLTGQHTILLVDYFYTHSSLPEDKINNFLKLQFLVPGVFTNKMTRVETNYMLRNLSLASVLHKKVLSNCYRRHLFVGAGNNV